MQNFMKKVIGLSIFLLLFSFTVHSVELQEEQKTEPGACQFQDYLFLLQGKKVAAIVNGASLVNKVQLIDTLLSLDIKITKIFSPEHGFKGKADAGSVIKDELYNNTIPVISLYGKKIMPSSEDMDGIDIMVLDLQDVGVRFYTYLSTLHYVMTACAKKNIPLIILDRPNPNGFYIDGPVLEEKYKSFVGLHPVPVVYGMTIGEYACMINGEKWLEDSLICNLTVIQCKNYDHNTYYELMVNPSPNLRTMRAIYLYPSLAFFEGTVVSEGRGTYFPFLIIGHPDYPSKNFSFVPESIKGMSESPKFKGQTCYGIDLRDYNIDSLKIKREINLQFLINMYQNLNLGEDFFNDYFDKLAGCSDLRNEIASGKSEKEIRISWKPGLDKFKKIRAKYLLYPDFKE
jgi:uncharacterized protein YbbC (DUF1343 family)